MAQAAIKAHLNPRQICFMGTAQTLNAFRDLLLGATADDLQAGQERILQSLPIGLQHSKTKICGSLPE
jgi:hypothetical protein